MPMNVLVSIATTPQALPAGIVAGLLRAALLDTTGAVVATQDVTGVTATFEGVAPGDYTATAVRLDSNGQVLGGSISAAFTVPAPAATFDAPATISVTLA